MYSLFAFFITSGDGSHGTVTASACRFVNFTVRIDESVALSDKSQFYSS